MRPPMTFQELEHLWQDQTPVKASLSAKDIQTKANLSLIRMKRKQNFTLGILGSTSLIIILFYIWVEAYKDLWQGLGLLVMIVMLFSRIGIELYQKNRLRTIDPTTDFKNYLLTHKAYFKSRKRVHFILTPVIYFIYFGGFASMLPAFKASLSSGFYTYIVISGSFTFLALAVFIGYHIKKELQELKFFEELISN
ncbi:hypothetical protein [Psychroflexus montanilacus]|uniref:hypothetical protein n=1 Tax=Psychroflexus montanilacus TaxID=2873598 RepID=UPI001CCA5742|nr:hypothetical protein [Psychroflexus montanilacus]MBZ9651899.1 hypothetical protein [Psychroflexus montanilacus]